MKAPKLPAQFSVFRQRGPRGFDMPTRFYDAEAEARKERLQRVRERGETIELMANDRALLGQRMRHSWQRQHQGNGRMARLALTLVGVSVVLFLLIRSFGLLNL